MKNTISLLLCFFSVSAFSSSVKITSFTQVRINETFNNPLAELCGLVESPSQPQTFITVIVDAGSRRPATYNTIAGADGKFCLPVITYRGIADVAIMGEKKTLRADLK